MSFGTHLPLDSQKRKETPVYSGVLSYFPKALAAIAEVSFLGNQKHNPGQPLHWARDKSTDHLDCIARHLLEAGTWDMDGGTPLRHSAKLAWRALANLELELEGYAQSVPKPVLELDPQTQISINSINYPSGAAPIPIRKDAGL